MMKNPDGSVTEGVYPDKEAVKITDLSPKTIGSIAKQSLKGRITVSAPSRGC